ncbi:YheT family hydrolase [Cellvibrio mixtus]|uniref:YheT family hydrolase n=1 Tax=Cellvibrio mixtus TaxID=39650 RepID=UPI000587E463|nr:alpha/beta fold hydrolase [Cellvibrio mixtus]
MPLKISDFRSPWWMFNGHLQTQLPVLLRRIKLTSRSISIPTQDCDQLSGNLYSAAAEPQQSLLIISHGLEGSNQQPYVLGMAQTALQQGVAGKLVDVLTWNLRGCGNPDNPSARLYYAGATQDFDDVITWAGEQGYKEIYLAAYSLGGNIVLKWLGDQGTAVYSRGIKSVCAASVPIDLAACVRTLDKWSNLIYRIYFVTSMKWRLKRKALKHPDKISLSGYSRVNSFYSYDDVFSAPLNGYGNATELHAKASAVHVLEKIAVPCLMVSAQNDPFINEDCIPRVVSENHRWLTLEVTASGGHVGFLSHDYEWWLDKRFLEFFKETG